MGESSQTRRRLLQGGVGAALGAVLARTGTLPDAADAASARGGPRVGELRLFAGDYVPRGWLGCTGEAIDRADHPELFDAIGDRFGTDGDLVKLPDLRGRAALGGGEVPGGAARRVGDIGSAVAAASTSDEPSSLGLTFLISTNHSPDVIEGEIRSFAFGLAPKNWIPCHGQELRIGQNAALFGIIHDRFGRNGRDSFRLPDLRGFTPVGHGDSPNLGRTEFGEARLHLAEAGGDRRPRLHVTYCISDSGDYPERP